MWEFPIYTLVKCLLVLLTVRSVQFNSDFKLELIWRATPGLFFPLNAPLPRPFLAFPLGRDQEGDPFENNQTERVT